jgi:hypothetical protein
MASSRSIELAFILILALGCAAAQAQPARVRGTISGFDGKVLSVRDAGGAPVQIQIQEKTEIVFTKPMSIGEIRPGDFLGVTSVKRPDGTLTAYEVRRFPKPLNPGHRPFDGRDDQTMTNATVGAMVQAASGRELTLTYEGGTQKIVVPENASISTLVPGSHAQLVPGAPVNLTMDAERVALRIQVGPPKL